MEGYAEEKVTNRFTANDSFHTSTPRDGIRSESELTSSVSCQQTTGQGCQDPQVGVVAA
jgi:hypothetical protein